MINHDWNILDTEFCVLRNILQALVLQGFDVLYRHVLHATVENPLACLEEHVGQLDVIDTRSGYSCLHRRLGSLRIDHAIVETSFLVPTSLQIFMSE